MAAGSTAAREGAGATLVDLQDEYEQGDHENAATDAEQAGEESADQSDAGQGKHSTGHTASLGSARVFRESHYSSLFGGIVVSHLVKRSLVVAVLGAALFSVAGCSAGGSEAAPSSTATEAPKPSATAEDQTVAEACDILNASMQDVGQQLMSSLTELQTDPTKAIELMDTIADELDTSLAEVGNDEVLTAGEDASGALHDFADTIETYLANPTGDTKVVTDSVTAVQDKLAAVSELCS